MTYHIQMCMQYVESQTPLLGGLMLWGMSGVLFEMSSFQGVVIREVPCAHTVPISLVYTQAPLTVCITVYILPPTIIIDVGSVVILLLRI